VDDQHGGADAEADDLLPQARGVSRCLARSGDRAAFLVRPDLAARRGHDFPLLIDAKYKRLEPEAAGAGGAPADLYQMFASAHRYDCPRVLMLYPQTADVPSAFRREFTLEGSAGKAVAVATVDLRQDLNGPAGRGRLVEGLRAVLTGG